MKQTQGKNFLSLVIEIPVTIKVLVLVGSKSLYLHKFYIAFHLGFQNHTSGHPPGGFGAAPLEPNIK